jgi:acyl-CoA thioesterase
MTGRRPDAFAALLGVRITRQGGGQAEATLTVGPDHLNPHGTAHGALLYSVAGVALAAAANDDEHSGVVSAVHIDYLSPARLGDRLVARAQVVERLAREDLFAVRLVRVTSPAGDDQTDHDATGENPDDGVEVVARLTARATRRRRHPAS